MLIVTSYDKDDDTLVVKADHECDNDTDDYYFVGGTTTTTTNFYYLQLKIVLSTVVLRRKSTIQPRTELRRFAKRG